MTNNPEGPGERADRSARPVRPKTPLHRMLVLIVTEQGKLGRQ